MGCIYLAWPSFRLNLLVIWPSRPRGSLLFYHCRLCHGLASSFPHPSTSPQPPSFPSLTPCPQSQPTVFFSLFHRPHPPPTPPPGTTPLNWPNASPHSLVHPLPPQPAKPRIPAPLYSPIPLHSYTQISPASSSPTLPASIRPWPSYCVRIRAGQGENFLPCTAPHLGPGHEI